MWLDDVLAQVVHEKKEALIKAWEEGEKCRAQNKAYQKPSSIQAWENSKKAELEAELKKIESWLPFVLLGFSMVVEGYDYRV